MENAGQHLVVIGGPTASGKTSLALTVAKALDTEIINADSRQLYKELKIGVARPEPEELAAVKHHLVAEVSVEKHYSAADFEEDAEKILDEIYQTHPVAVVSGGTGLYIQSLLKGFDPLPVISKEIRGRVQAIFDKGGIQALVDALLESDIKAGENVNLQNPARVRRALEVWLQTGKPIASWWTGENKNQSREVHGYYLNPDRDQLYEQINRRVDRMIGAGLENEVRNLYPFRHLKALQTVGYSEFFQYFDAEISYETCVSLIKQHTRNYAKRQLTWFRNQTNFKAVTPEHASAIIFADLTSYGLSIHQ